MTPEFVSLALSDELANRKMSHVEFARSMQPGFATTYAWLGARTWDPEKLVTATTMPQPSRAQRLRAITRKNFLTQTGGITPPPR